MLEHILGNFILKDILYRLQATRSGADSRIYVVTLGPLEGFWSTRENFRTFIRNFKYSIL
jgi:hypothetical protein